VIYQGGHPVRYAGWSIFYLRDIPVKTPAKNDILHAKETQVEWRRRNKTQTVEESVDWMIDIKDIQALYADKAVVLTQHFLDKIGKRGIAFADVKSAIGVGGIIEQYPDDYPYPSALILGYTDDNKPLHAVIGVGGGYAWLITAYYPDPKKWESDYKTRKAEV